MWPIGVYVAEISNPELKLVVLLTHVRWFQLRHLQIGRTARSPCHDSPSVGVSFHYLTFCLSGGDPVLYTAWKQYHQSVMIYRTQGGKCKRRALKIPVHSVVLSMSNFLRIPCHLINIIWEGIMAERREIFEALTSLIDSATSYLGGDSWHLNAKVVLIREQPF